MDFNSLFRFYNPQLYCYVSVSPLSSVSLQDRLYLPGTKTAKKQPKHSGAFKLLKLQIFFSGVGGE